MRQRVLAPCSMGVNRSGLAAGADPEVAGDARRRQRPFRGRRGAL